MLAFVSVLATMSAASAAVAATPDVSLVQAVNRTERAPTFRYVMTVSVARTNHAAVMLHIEGARSRTALTVHVQELSAALPNGVAVPGPQQSALIDGPFLYEGAPNGIAVYGKIRWLRLPVARIGPQAPALSAVRDLSPAPLMRLLDEWRHAKASSANGWFRGSVAYDDPIVLTALSGITHGIEFRDIHFAAHAGTEGYLHTISVTGRTADGLRTLRVDARLFAFGQPVRVKIPAEGTFMDQKLLDLEE